MLTPQKELHLGSSAAFIYLCCVSSVANLQVVPGALLGIQLIIKPVVLHMKAHFRHYLNSLLKCLRIMNAPVPLMSCVSP